MNDEGFREIQLNGKQLVFLFIAATVVSVVIFLFGVMVGRGVRGDADALETASSDPASTSTSAAATAETPTPSSPAADPAAGKAPAATPPPASELSYADRLLRDAPPEETLKAAPATSPEKTAAPAAPAIQEPVAPQPMPATQKPTTPDAEKPTTSVTTSTIPKSATPVPESRPSQTPAIAAPAADASGPGFAVQVAAYRDRREADTLANQLIAKGYPAFVMEPAKGAPMPYFRVRVGKYKTRQDAEAVSAKLQKAEQLTKAWIAR